MSVKSFIILMVVIFVLLTLKDAYFHSQPIVKEVDYQAKFYERDSDFQACSTSWDDIFKNQFKTTWKDSI